MYVRVRVGTVKSVINVKVKYLRFTYRIIQYDVHHYFRVLAHAMAAISAAPFPEPSSACTSLSARQFPHISSIASSMSA